MKYKRIAFTISALVTLIIVFFWACERTETTAPTATPGDIELSSTSGLRGNGVNLQPSYYCSGDMNLGWDLMDNYPNIQTLRIELDPGEGSTISDFVRWISEANSHGYDVIATYHNYQDNGSPDQNTLITAANWWVANWSSLSSAGSFTVNLMNEWGDHNVTVQQYANAYNQAISIVRQVYSGPIICDIPGWGQETHTAADASSSINDNNIIFSVHIYRSAWNSATGNYMVNSDLDYLGNSGRPCMVGEFGNGGDGSADWSGLVDHARGKGWSVIGWCWNGDGSGMNMISPYWGDNCNATSYTESSYFNTIYSKLGGGGGTTTTTAATTSTTTTAATTTTTAAGDCDCGTCRWYGFDVPACCTQTTGWGWQDGGCNRTCVGCQTCIDAGQTCTNCSQCGGATTTTTTAATTSTTTTSATTSTTTTSATTTTTSAGGETCSPVDAEISAPFTQNGAGEYCWTATSCNYINSWNLQELTINGEDFTNAWASSSNLPAKIDGKWYIHYVGNYGWSHFELR